MEESPLLAFVQSHIMEAQCGMVSSVVFFSAGLLAIVVSSNGSRNTMVPMNRHCIQQDLDIAQPIIFNTAQ